MTITCDTELSEILDSTAIVNVLNENRDSMLSEIDKRQTTISTASPNLEGMGIDGETPYYNACGTQLTQLGELAVSINKITNDTCNEAIDQEKSELGTLTTKLDEKLDELETEYKKIDGDYKASLAKSVNAAENSGKKDSEIEDIKQEVYNYYYGPNGIAATNRKEWQKYYDKYKAVIDRRKVLGEDVDLYDLLPDNTSTPNAMEGAAETPATYDTYTIPTEGRTTQQMQEDEKNLSDILVEENEYLTEAYASIQYSSDVLEAQYKLGNISQETYEQLRAEYDQKLWALEDAMDLREETCDLIASGGALSDINSNAEQIQPLDQFIREYGLNGINQNIIQDYGGDPYGESIGNSPSSTNYISSTTRMAALDYAKQTGTATPLSDAPEGSYIFSTSAYFNVSPDGWTQVPGMMMRTNSEYYVADTAFNREDMCADGDTVYIYDPETGTGKFYSYLEWVGEIPEKGY